MISGNISYCYLIEISFSNITKETGMTNLYKVFFFVLISIYIKKKTYNPTNVIWWFKIVTLDIRDQSL